LTRLQWEENVLSYLRRYNGYFTVFWACENQWRAHAIDRLAEKGRIVYGHEGLGYPNCHAMILEE
jgi:hypothetical protein